MKKSGIGSAVARLPKKPGPADVVEAEEKPEKRQTLYLPNPVHDQIRDAAHAKRISQQEIFRRALDLWFAQEGLASWKELTGK